MQHYKSKEPHAKCSVQIFLHLACKSKSMHEKYIECALHNIGLVVVKKIAIKVGLCWVVRKICREFRKENNFKLKEFEKYFVNYVTLK